MLNIKNRRKHKRQLTDKRYWEDKYRFAIDVLEFILSKELYYELEGITNNIYIYINEPYTVIKFGEDTDYQYTFNSLHCQNMKCEYGEVYRTSSIFTLIDLMKRDGWI